MVFYGVVAGTQDGDIGEINVYEGLVALHKREKFSAIFMNKCFRGATELLFIF